MSLLWPVDLVWGVLMRHLGLDFDAADLLPTPEYLRALRDRHSRAA